MVTALIKFLLSVWIGWQWMRLEANARSLGYSYLPPSGNDFGLSSGPPISIISFGAKVNTDGSYSYEYESENGIQVEETGYLKPVGIKGAQTAEGSFSYVSPEGKMIEVKYTADENGFRPQGSHLPTPPPIPPEIQESLRSHGDPKGGSSSSFEGLSGGYYY